jgi:hypothetical protein
MVNTATTQSAITNGQIGQIQDRLATELRESGLPTDAVQAALSAPGGKAIKEMAAVFRRFVEMMASMIVRVVCPDRTLTPNEMLKQTGRDLYVNNKVVACMPRGEGDKAEVIFFKPETWEYTKPGYMSDEDLEKAYERRGLKPADPYSQAQANKDDPALADTRPNATHWKDMDGKWCFATFNGWIGERRVYCNRNDRDWVGYWVFAGLRKLFYFPHYVGFILMP